MDKLIEQYIDQLIELSSDSKFIWNIEKIKSNKPMTWNYIDGCLFTSFIEIYKLTQNQKYLDFVKKCIDSFVDENGEIATYEINNHNLDDICESRVLFFLHKHFGEEKYLKAIEKTFEQIKNQPRTYEGSFWHKDIYPNQVWLDGLFMVMPFYVQYLNMNNDHQYLDVIKQYQIVYQRMFDEKEQLYYHGYDASKSIFWANPKTGLSKNFWLRSISWYLVSMVDVLEYSQNNEFNQYLKERIQELINGLLRYQDQSSQMFYQLVSKPTLEGNYLETSGSAMIAYAILKGVRLQALAPSYQVLGRNIFQGICKKYLTIKDGKLALGGICLVAGLGPSNNLRRDGSEVYYLSEPIVENDAKGVAPFIMAFVETKR